MTVRVRFAPSPTGALHVGSARTALFNWLFARHHNGTFILRIEDTDLERSTEASVKTIFDGMRWLGLDWDEGPDVGGPYAPYFQTQRLDLYREYAQKLIDMGRAYYCYCTPEELDARRKEAAEKGEAPRYDRKCLHLTQAEVEKYKAEGRRPIIRFKVEDSGRTVVKDLIRGKVTFENNVLDDFVMVKSDGIPTYNYAVVIDDATMGITHVIRGEDHLPNTPKQIQIYQALGFSLPEFAHIPMILGPDRTKLSKRHGATAASQYEADGFLPEAMMNYLALLGWSYNGTDQIFSQEELIKYFTLDKCSKNPAIFDVKKLSWMNGVYIRNLNPDVLYERMLPYLQKDGLLPSEPGDELKEYTKKVLQSLQTRAKTLVELASSAEYFFRDEVHFDPEALPFLEPEYVPKLLSTLSERLAKLEPFTAVAVEELFNALREEMGISAGEMIHPVRVALTGKKVSPGIYEVVEILGRARVSQRLREGALKAREMRK